MLAGSAVNVVVQLLRVIIQIAGTAILARLLTPQDFGIVAMAGAALGFITVFGDLGMSTAVVQMKIFDPRIVSAIFKTGMLVALVVAASSLVVAPIAAWAFGEPALVGVVMLSALAAPLAAIGIQQNAVLMREGRWVALGSATLGGQLAALIIAVILATVFHFGFWALVIQGLMAPAVSSALAWSFCRTWRPDLRVAVVEARPILRFSLELTAYNVVNFFHRQFDNALVGWRWGNEALGNYSRAYTILLMPINMINGPVSAVMLPILSRHQDDREQWRSHFLSSFSALNYIGIMMATIIFANAQSIVAVLLGPQWPEAGVILKYLSISIFVSSPMNAMGWIYVSLGRTRRMLRWGLASTAVIVASFFVGLPHGAAGLALAYSVAICLLFIPCLKTATYRSPVSTGELLRAAAGPLGAAALTVAIMQMLAPVIESFGDISQLFIGITTVTLIYIVIAMATLMFDPAQKILLGHLSNLFIVFKQTWIVRRRS